MQNQTPKSYRIEQGTAEHKIAMQTLTYIRSEKNTTTFSDLGLASLTTAYEQRVAATVRAAGDCKTCSFYGKKCAGPSGWCPWK